MFNRGGRNLKVAATAQNSHVTPERVAFAIRNRFNPIKDFTPLKLTRQLDGYHAGDLKDVARTWEAMEDRDLYLRNVISKRKKSVARLPWEILTEDDSDEAKRQAEVLEEFYNDLTATSVLKQDERGGLSLLVRQMMDAVGKGFAVHEVVWRPDPSGLKAEFRFCPLWWFENRTGKLRFLPSEAALEGEEMLPGEWLVTCGEALMESSSVAYVFKHMPLKDWLGYSEKFGMPGVLGKTNAAAGSDQWNAMEEAVRAFGQDWAAVASMQDTIELVEVKGGQNLPFPPLVDYCDRALAALWRGADLSTISQGKEGVGASLQSDETNLLLEDDAKLISETLNERVDRFVLEYTFGPGVEPLAYIKLQGRASPSEMAFRRDVFKAFQADGTVGDIMANLTDLKELVAEVGLPVNNEYVDPYVPVVSDKGPVTGEVRLDSAGDIVGGEVKEETIGPLENEVVRGEGRGARERARFARETQRVFKPVAQRLQEALAITDPSLQRVALRELVDAIPGLAEVINKTPGNAGSLEESMQAALLKGMKAGGRERARSN